VLAGGGANNCLSAFDGTGSGERRDRGDGGMDAHAHLVPRNEKAQVDTARFESCDKGTLVAVMPRHSLHLAWGKPPALDDYRTRIPAFLSAPEHRPVRDVDHGAMIVHVRVRFLRIRHDTGGEWPAMG
jgi:hypothetical protein